MGKEWLIELAAKLLARHLTEEKIAEYAAIALAYLTNNVLPQLQKYKAEIIAKLREYAAANNDPSKPWTLIDDKGVQFIEAFLNGVVPTP